MKSKESRYERMLSGDRKVFRKFYEETFQSLGVWVLSRVESVQDAEEIVQDIYLSFLDSLPLFRKKSSLKTFLYAIARHEVNDYWRKKYAKKAIKTIPFIDQIYTEKLYSSAVLNQEIEVVFEKMRSDYVVILRLKYELGFKVVEISEKIGISKKATESRLFRARKDFQATYTELFQI
ncbi:RNA polymerase sigma factor [Patescibacteria group bacterium]